MIPQLIVLALWLSGLSISASRHGEVKKQEKYNVWINLLSSLIMMSLFYFGGFWDVILKHL